MFGVALIYWKLIEKKPLSKMGLTKRFGNYFIGAAIGIVLLFVSVCAIIVTGNIEFHGLFKNADIFMIILLLGGLLFREQPKKFSAEELCFIRLKKKHLLGLR